jgi:hypothetical protein
MPSRSNIAFDLLCGVKSNCTKKTNIIGLFFGNIVIHTENGETFVIRKTVISRFPKKKNKNKNKLKFCHHQREIVFVSCDLHCPQKKFYKNVPLFFFVSNSITQKFPLQKKFKSKK